MSPFVELYLLIVGIGLVILMSIFTLAICTVAVGYIWIRWFAKNAKEVIEDAMMYAVGPFRQTLYCGRN